MGWMLEESWIDSRRSKRTSSCILVKRPDWRWGPPILLLNGCHLLFLQGYSGLGMKLTNHPHIVPRSIISYVLPPVPCMLSWRAVYLETNKCTQNFGRKDTLGRPRLRRKFNINSVDWTIWSSGMFLRSALFWVFTQRKLTVFLPAFRHNISVQSSRVHEDGTDSLSRNVGTILPV